MKNSSYQCLTSILSCSSFFYDDKQRSNNFGSNVPATRSNGLHTNQGRVVQSWVRWLDIVFPRSIPPKFKRKLRRHKQRFGKIDITVVLDKDENLL